jgi:hypothetical protein
MIRKISNALAWLGGANLAILNRAPTTRGKFVQMGLVLLTTASIAGLAMTFFMNQEVKEPEATAAVVGVFWGFIILNIDRFLVVSMGATREKRRLIWMAVPRLLLAIVISLVVSTPITLRIFQSDINYQLRVSQANQSAYLNGLEAKSGLATQQKQLQAQISRDQSILDGQLPATVTNPQLQTAQQEVAQLQPKVAAAKRAEINAYEAWQCELYGYGIGCAGASNRAGNGPIAQAKQQTYEQAVSTYDSLNAQLQTAEQNEKTAEAGLAQAQAAAETRYQTAARNEIGGLQAKLKTIDAQIATAKANDQTTINQHTGTLAQLSALWTASAGNPILLLAHLTVMALFFLIELLPVLVKFLLNLGPLDAYERVFKAEEEKTSDQVKRDRLKERRLADAASRAEITVAEDKSNREADLGIKANKFVAAKMEDILNVALAQWSAQVTAVLNGTPVAPNGTPHPPPGTPPTGATPGGSAKHRAGPPPTNTPNGAGAAFPAPPAPAQGVPPQGAPSPAAPSPAALPTAAPTAGPATPPAAPAPSPNGFGLPPAGSKL